ncbi:MAG: polysaccharide biosynthesis C-terminal domain-containing protein [Cytophagales bacterium]|nr:polysaccharide biosynthesis C-terminal domain-containing protein [Bernardetiaceae bacterium]MDW8204461.1 polysaccharide biosynthesis C-terminal domain-containing protein [Cytophagales bacterium]
MGLLKKLGSETAIYGISSIVGRAVNSVLMVPFHTAVFTDPSEYGINSVFYAYAAFFNVIYTFGMETAFFRFATRERLRLQAYFNQAVTAVAVVAFVGSGLLWLFADKLAAWIQYPGLGLYVRCFALLFAIDALVAIPFARLRLEGRPLLFASLKLGSIFLYVLLNFFFLYVCRKAIAGERFVFMQSVAQQIFKPQWAVGYIFLANLIANAAQLPAFAFVFRGFRPQWHWHMLQPMLRYAYPLLFMGLAGIVNEVIDRQMLKWLLPEGFYPGISTDGAIGIYSACFKFGVFITLAVQAFRYAAEPFFFAQAADKNSPELFARVMHYFVLACLLMYVGIGANVEWIQYLLLGSEAYREGLAVVPVLLLANCLLGIYYNLTVWFKITDRTYYGTWFAMLGAVVTLIGNYLLIPVMGYMGAALMHLICYAVMSAVCLYYGQQFYPIPYRWQRSLQYALIGTVIIYVVQTADFQHFVLNQAFNFLLSAGFVAIIFVREIRPLLSQRKVSG